MNNPTDLEGLQKQMIIDCLNDLIKWCDDKSDNLEDIDKLTKRNEQRTEYLKSIKQQSNGDVK